MIHDTLKSRGLLTEGDATAFRHGPGRMQAACARPGGTLISSQSSSMVLPAKSRGRRLRASALALWSEERGELRVRGEPERPV